MDTNPDSIAAEFQKHTHIQPSYLLYLILEFLGVTKDESELGKPLECRTLLLGEDMKPVGTLIRTPNKISITKREH